MRLRSSLLAAPVAAGLSVAGVAAALSGAAFAATSCAVMTLEADSTGTLVLSPQSVTVDNGGCVQFSNQTIFAARFSVGSYDRTVPAFSQTAGSSNYTAAPAGATQTVVAREAAGNASGTIVIRSAPTHSPSPTPRHTSQSVPAHQPSSAPTPTTRTQPATAGSSAPAPKKSKPTPRRASGTPTPASSSFLTGQPTASPSSPPVAAVGGPLQPSSGRGTGLPGALAALAIVATAGALLRVLLAEPVDRPHSVGARS